MITLINGDARKIPLRNESIQCVVTSPPYYGLRDYKTPGQIGLEKTPEEFVAEIVEVFREVRRVLRKDGTVWLNLGDSYNGSGGDHKPEGKNDAGFQGKSFHGTQPKYLRGDLKHKDLIGIPWRVAFALQADGWWLRQDIIWHKPNPMPESVTDRCTKSHEYLFLLAKSANYYYDNFAIMEPAAYDGRNNTVFKGSTKYNADTLARFGGERWPNKIPKNLEYDGQKPRSMHVKRANGEGEPEPMGYIDGVPARNKRDVWTIPTSPYKGAHFAVFPPALVEPCILAGTSAKGCCPKCGAPWERITRAEGGTIGKSWTDHSADLEKGLTQGIDGVSKSTLMNRAEKENPYRRIEIGWQPTCDCNAGDPIPCTVLDPFSGTATVGVVAVKHQREYVGIELNPKYNELAKKRLSGTQISLIIT